MFASLTDIQTWIQSDKIVVDDANSQKENLDAMRTIKGQLAGYFSQVVIASWDSPDNTPSQIRQIAGRLTAAMMYRRIYSEEGMDVPEYATTLYNEALAMLNGIITGQITILDDADEPIDTTGANMLSFWPNDNTPIFTVTQEFA